MGTRQFVFKYARVIIVQLTINNIGRQRDPWGPGDNFPGFIYQSCRMLVLGRKN